jgi:hypothetical protein
MGDSTSYDRFNTVLSKAVGTEISCEPADRGTAEEAVELAYRSAKRDGPQRVIWCGSPIAIAKQIAAGSASRQIGRPLKRSMVQGGPAPADHAARPATLSSLSALCVEDADTELFRPSVRLCHLATRLLGSPSILPRSSFREIAAPYEELGAFSVSWFLDRGQRRSADAAVLVSAIGEISRSASLFVRRSRTSAGFLRGRLMFVPMGRAGFTAPTARLSAIPTVMRSIHGKAYAYSGGWSNAPKRSRIARSMRSWTQLSVTP